MIKRVVEISNPAYLSLKNRQMVVKVEGGETATVPVEDMGILILNHPGITHSQGLLSACWQNNVGVLLCDEKRLPGAILLPLDGHSLHSKIIAHQARTKEPVKKRLWQEIIRAKIIEQARVLQEISGDSGPLVAFADRVRSGDPENLEGHGESARTVQFFLTCPGAFMKKIKMFHN